MLRTMLRTATKAATLKQLRTGLVVPDKGLSPAALRELKRNHDAAVHASRDALPMDELMKMRRMEERSKGSFTREIGRLLLATGISPLEFLIREMRDVNNNKELRVKCAVDALPYIHAKLPSEMKVDAAPGTTVNFIGVQQNQLTALSDKELDQLSMLAEKLRPPIDVTPAAA